jgi:hypothetical protein
VVVECGGEAPGGGGTGVCEKLGMKGLEGEGKGGGDGRGYEWKKVGGRREEW